MSWELTGDSVMSTESRLRRLVRMAVRFRVVLYLLVALVVLDIVVRVNAWRWRAYAPVYYRERMEACQQGQWDLVVVGGSPTLCGIDVAVLTGANWKGRPLGRGFNLGLPLATTAEVCHAVEHGVHRPPRLLLYGIAATDLNGSRLAPEGPCLLMSASDVARWTRARPEAARWALSKHLGERVASLWALSYYRDGIRLWAADLVGSLWSELCPDAVSEARENLQRTERLHSERGFVALGPVSPEHRLSYLKASGQPVPAFWFLDRYQVDGYLAYLQRWFDWGERQGTAVVLVNMPVTADLEQRIHPREFTIYRTTLQKVAAARGVRVLWPTREEVGLTDADFCDLIHLNADGAARLSTWIRRAVETLSAPPRISPRTRRGR